MSGPQRAPSSRLRDLTGVSENADGRYVLYWCTAQRRPVFNPALEHAAAVAAENGLPLVVLEPLRVGYRYASDRFHAFVLQGMAHNRAAFRERGVFHHAYVEPEDGAGKGLLAAWAQDARLVVADDHPGFFYPRMLAAAARLAAPIVAVDGVGLLPLSATPKAHARAVDFRRFLQKNLLPHLAWTPQADPLAGLALPAFGSEHAPAGLLERWGQADDALLTGRVEELASLPIDHGVGPVDRAGGHSAARARWERFFSDSLPTYGQDRNHPDSDGASGLSPWLHFGHISVFELFADIVAAEDWSPDHTADRVRGQREGWWGMSPGVESFLDEVLTWRELGHHFVHHTAEPHRWETLPEWARKTLEVHAEDARDHVYSLDQLDHAQTHDPVWNAAQRQLVQTGRMHNYLRMLWGKRVLEWLPHPQHALPVLFHLNDKYALDGRDPNTVSGVSWVFGRFDRAWGPERPIFGKIRYMSSENTVRKLKMWRYLERWAD